MVVREVRFQRAAAIGPDGDPVPTGDTVVKLSLSEGWLSMVYREMRAQLWGIVGGMVAGGLLTILTVLTSFGGGMLRRVRKLKVLNRSNREDSVEEPERKIEDDASAGSACPKNRTSGSKTLISQ